MYMYIAHFVIIFNYIVIIDLLSVKYLYYISILQFEYCVYQ